MKANTVRPRSESLDAKPVATPESTPSGKKSSSLKSPKLPSSLKSPKRDKRDRDKDKERGAESPSSDEKQLTPRGRRLKEKREKRKERRDGDDDDSEFSERHDEHRTKRTTSLATLSADEQSTDSETSTASTSISPRAALKRLNKRRSDRDLPRSPRDSTVTRDVTPTHDGAATVLGTSLLTGIDTVLRAWESAAVEVITFSAFTEKLHEAGWSDSEAARDVLEALFRYHHAHGDLTLDGKARLSALVAMFRITQSFLRADVTLGDRISEALPCTLFSAPNRRLRDSSAAKNGRLDE